jgi:hypothetical protein
MFSLCCDVYLFCYCSTITAVISRYEKRKEKEIVDIYIAHGFVTYVGV